MNKIIAAILSFLLWIMPWWTGLFNMRERVAFDKDDIMDKIISCVQEDDVATLESMMRPWLKENTPDLTAKITQLYDAIDGNIISMRKGAEGSRYDGGIHSVDLRFVLDTDKPEHYYLTMMYDVSNANDRKEVGISSIRLATGLVGASDRVIHFTLNTPEWD